MPNYESRISQWATRPQFAIHNSQFMILEEERSFADAFH